METRNHTLPLKASCIFFKCLSSIAQLGKDTVLHCCVQQPNQPHQLQTLDTLLPGVDRKYSISRACEKRLCRHSYRPVVETAQIAWRMQAKGYKQKPRAMPCGRQGIAAGISQVQGHNDRSDAKQQTSCFYNKPHAILGGDPTNNHG